jgi:hypothetical protein
MTGRLASLASSDDEGAKLTRFVPLVFDAAEVSLDFVASLGRGARAARRIWPAAFRFLRSTRRERSRHYFTLRVLLNHSTYVNH